MIRIAAGLVTSRGPCNDKREAKAVITQAFAVHCPHSLLADAGYDAEWVHVLCRGEWGVKSFIPSVKRHYRAGNKILHQTAKFRQIMKNALTL